MTTSTLRSRQAYCVATLAQADLSPARRQTVESKLATITTALAARCSHCGRHLEAAESIANGIGPVCAHKAA